MTTNTDQIAVIVTPMITVKGDGTVYVDLAECMQAYKAGKEVHDFRAVSEDEPTFPAAMHLANQIDSVIDNEGAAGFLRALADQLDAQMKAANDA